MYFGAAYYPEHWPEDRWHTDVKMMKEACFNVVRMAEFAWTRMEPTEGVYDFEWLDSSINLLAENGIKTILGTPSAAPPKWLVDKHPDIYPLDYMGHIKGYGHRRYYCYNNHNYHHYVRTITAKMAERYGSNTNVIGWQIDNEIGCVNTVRCFCANCREEFKRWLRNKYANISELNEKWGTIFSSQIYGSWDQIILPAYDAMSIHNPGLELDYRRFASDSVIGFQKLQADILKEKTQEQIVTTNLMPWFTQIDYFKLVKDLDIAAFDIYPNNSRSNPTDPGECAMLYDQIRGIGNGNFWVLELQSGAPGGEIIRKTPKPGELRKWTWQAIAHGADAITYFRWRTCIFGLEEFWHGILDHSGLPNRRYNEVQKVGSELATLNGLIEDSTSGACVAMVFSYDIDWVFEIQPQIKGYNYTNHFLNFYKCFYKNNIPVDIVSMDSDFSEYRLLVVPNLIMATDSFKEKIYKYVASGGYIIMDFRTGAKDWDNRMQPMQLPGEFRELLGITVEEYGVLETGENTTLKHLETGVEYIGLEWYDVVCPEQAETLVEYYSDYYSGKAAVTCNRYGEGKAFYIGTRMDSGLLEKLTCNICCECGINSLLDIKCEGLEIVQRYKTDAVYYFIINHNKQNVKFQLAVTYFELLSGKHLQGEVEIGANDVMVLLEKLV